MSSRTKRILEMCNSSTKKLATESILGSQYISKFKNMSGTKDRQADKKGIENKENCFIPEEEQADKRVIENKKNYCTSEQKQDFNILDMPIDILDGSFVFEEFDVDRYCSATCSQERTTDEENNDGEIEYNSLIEENRDNCSSRNVSGAESEAKSTNENQEDKDENQEVADHKSRRVLGVNRKKVNQELRMKGKKYVGHRRPANQSKTFQDITRESRKLGPTCSSSFCLKSTKRQCNQINNTMREELFTKFWEDLNWEQRATFVCKLVTKDPPTQRRIVIDSSIDPRRTGTLKYSIRVENNVFPVCKQMFLSTFGL